MSSDYNPFQSPAVPSQANVGVSWPIVPFESGHQRATMAIVLLAITGLICILAAIGSVVQYASLQAQPDGTFIVTKSGVAIAEGTNLLGTVNFFVFVGTVIAFCMWTHRAARNLPALGARGLKYTPAWAVGWFFIPLANLVMPYLVAAEIWRESDPAQKDLDGQAGKTTSPLVAGWWFTYIVYAVVPTVVGAAVGLVIGFSIAARHGDPQELVQGIAHYLPTFLVLGLVAQMLGLLATILAIMYVYRVDGNQQAKFDLIHGRGFGA